ncbi:MAG: ComF family protein [Acidimicrobiia bacterium]
MLSRLAFPAVCSGCGVSAEPLCSECVAGLRSIGCIPAPAGLEWAAAAFAYEGAARELIAKMKYHNARAGLGWLAGQIANTARSAGRVDDIELVTWPPTTPARRRERGFDLAELLARSVARRLGRPAAVTLSRHGGSAQTGRSRAERSEGPAFVVRQRRVSGRSVLLVDDVVTTGATLKGAGRALRVGGASAVAAVVGAHTTSRSMAAEPTSWERLSIQGAAGREPRRGRA